MHYVLVNPCDPLPCLNGGSCLAGLENRNSFECLCFNGYYGTICEMGDYYEFVAVHLNVTKDQFKSIWILQ